MLLLVVVAPSAAACCCNYFTVIVAAECANADPPYFPALPDVDAILPHYVPLSTVVQPSTVKRALESRKRVGHYRSGHFNFGDHGCISDYGVQRSVEIELYDRRGHLQAHKHTNKFHPERYY